MQETQTRKPVNLTFVIALFLVLASAVWGGIALLLQRLFSMTTGDSFTAVGALLSGFGFAGVIVAVRQFQAQMQSIENEAKLAKEDQNRILYALMIGPRIHSTAALLEYYGEKVKSKEGNSDDKSKYNRLADNLVQLRSEAAHGPETWKWKKLDLWSGPI